MNIYLEVPASKSLVGSELTLGPALVGWSTTVSILWGALSVGCDRKEMISSRTTHPNLIAKHHPAAPAMTAATLVLVEQIPGQTHRLN